ncbi:MAG: type IX secretion system outer membrane channel protein PorV [Bacteroidales bacterium]|nr:type IX secretion system outer membrane channel protein PorV [Bacteroidales bacterium]
MKTQHTRTSSFVLLLILLFTQIAQAQVSETGQTGKNYISTGMPILLIAPDARAGGMGDVGVATRPDAYSSHWNGAKYAFIENSFGLSTTYTPWLRNLGVGDMNLIYLGGYGQINKRSTLALSLTYFSLGDIESTNEFGDSQGNMHPNEFALDGTYAMRLGDNFSIAATGRWNHSDLTNGQDVDNQSTKAANSIAADFGVYYQEKMTNGKEFALGLLISNLGAKLSYSDDDTRKEFLPANLRLGGRYTMDIDSYNQVSAMLDINKLLVPTPPVKEDGESTADYTRRYNDYTNTGSVQGALQALYDAPGGMKEKLQELQFSVGAEYWYNHTFAARAGYFYEHANKGGRRYLTVGAGIRYNVFTIDLSYLVPTTKFSTNPLSNTVRISLSVDFARGSLSSSKEGESSSINL